MSLAPSHIRGHNLEFRAVSVDDAAYIHGLRTNPAYNAHLSQVTGTIADQAAWIETYRPREAAGLEIYYVMRRLDNKTPCGVVRLYGITETEFTWGSWILDQNKPAKAALESAAMVYRVGFDHLGLPRAVFDVRNDNERTLSFHLRFGAVETGKDAQDTFFVLSAAEFAERRPAFDAIITKVPA